MAANKKRRKPAARRKPKHGHGELQTGNPGNKGGGRTPDAFKAMCRELASSDVVKREVDAIIDQGRRHPMFLAALKWSSDHGYGKPAQQVHVSAPDGGPIQIAPITWDFGKGRKVTF